MRLSIFIIVFLEIGVAGKGQNPVTLKDLVALAQTQSPQYKLQETQRELSHYTFLTYKSSLKPQISLYGNAPMYSKQYTGIVQPDGTIAYLPIKQNVANIGLSLSQQLPFSGGTISLNTELNRFDDLQGKTHQYNGTPVFLQLNQPLLGFNQLKWSKKIEPLRLEESMRAFAQAMESIAQSINGQYFNVLDAQENIHISETNLKNTRENYEIEKKRVDLGTTTEDKLLQLELQLLTNRQNLEKARYNYQITLLALKASLGSKDSTDLLLILPEDIPQFDPDLNLALEYAHKYRPEFIAFERKRLEAEANVDNARAAKQQININTTFGLNRAGTNLGIIYSSPKDQQTFSIGLNMPVIDWGRRSAAYNTAKANQKLTKYNNEIDEIYYNQEIITLIKNIPLLRGNISLTKSRDSVAQKRYLIANKLYQVGKLSISDLNIAQNEKDSARQEYVFALRSFWDAYYLLRRVALFDFENNKALYP